MSVPLRSAMVHWPSDPPVQIERVRDMEQGDTVNLSTISMGSHTGTHMDAPLHFIRRGMGIDKMPLDTTVGRARVIEIEDTESIKPEELVPHQIRRGERILFKTRNSLRVWQTDTFMEDFVFISSEAARFLVECRVRVVGVDYLSVGGFQRDGSYIHQTLLGGGVWIIEGLDLSRVSPGKYDLVCLPLKVDQGDGAPARAILRPVPAGGARKKEG
ncbi:MAG: cyclase family protein [Dehalococcoidia bacterium]